MVILIFSQEKQVRNITNSVINIGGVMLTCHIFLTCHFDLLSSIAKLKLTYFSVISVMND